MSSGNGLNSFPICEKTVVLKKKKKFDAQNVILGDDEEEDYVGKYTTPDTLLVRDFLCCKKSFLVVFSLKKRPTMEFWQSYPCLTHSQTVGIFMCLLYKSFENTVGKGEIACKEQSPLAVFSTLLENISPFSSNLKLSSANSVSLEES